MPLLLSLLAIVPDRFSAILDQVCSAELWEERCALPMLLLYVLLLSDLAIL